MSLRPPTNRARSYADVARSVRGWTSNLLASAIVLVLALVVGRQLIQWWRVETQQAAEPALPASVPLADPRTAGLLDLAFGELPFEIQRRTVAADRPAAIEQLIAVCRDAAGNAPLAEFGPAEERLLALAADAQPVAEGPAGLRLFAPAQSLPLVVATRPAAAGEAQLGAGRRRVVTWGLAAPAAAGTWNLYVAHSGRAPAAIPSHDLVPIPPDSYRTLAVRDIHGGSLSAFSGNGQAADWAAFFTAWFERQAWTGSGSWDASTGGWQAHYERSGNAGRTTVDVQIHADGGSELVGLISTAAESPASE